MTKILVFEKDKERFKRKKPEGGAEVIGADEYKERNFLLNSEKLSRLTFNQLRDYILFLRYPPSSNIHLTTVNTHHLTTVDHEIFSLVKNPDTLIADCAECLNVYVDEIEDEKEKAETEKAEEGVIIMKTRYSFMKWIEELFEEKIENEGSI